MPVSAAFTASTYLNKYIPVYVTLHCKAEVKYVLLQSGITLKTQSWPAGLGV